MIRGIYTAAAGLTTATLRLGVVSNNVANAATPGYKQDRLPDEVGKSARPEQAARSTPRAARSASSPSAPRSASRELDLAAGPMQETSNPLDLAIAGNGFFAVQSRGRPDALHPRRRLLEGRRRHPAHARWLGRPERRRSTDRCCRRRRRRRRRWHRPGHGRHVAQLQIVDFAPGDQLEQSRQRPVRAGQWRAPQPAAGRSSTRATWKARTST